jgi:hypothetical protein
MTDEAVKVAKKVRQKGPSNEEFIVAVNTSATLEEALSRTKMLEPSFKARCARLRKAGCELYSFKTDRRRRSTNIDELKQIAEKALRERATLLNEPNGDDNASTTQSSEDSA